MLFNDVYTLLIESRSEYKPIKENIFGTEKVSPKKSEKDLPDTTKRLLGLGLDKKGPRQQKWGTGQQRLHQNFVPQMHKADGSLNRKIEILRKTPGKMVATPTDLKYALDKYNISGLSKKTRRDNPKFLGTTGIMVYYNPSRLSYTFEKPIR